MIDPDAIRAVRDAQRLRDEWARWLLTFHWTHCVTATWERPVSATAALGTVARWLGTHAHVAAAVGVSRGPTDERNHVHLLLHAEPMVASHLRGRWIKRGHVLMESFTHGSAAFVHYVAAQSDAIDLIGTPVPFVPRRKRRR